MKADRLRAVRLEEAEVARNGDELDDKSVFTKSDKAVVLCDINGKNVGNAIEKAAAQVDDRSRDTAGTPLRVDQEKRLRREIANSNERRRMQSINAGFQTLRSLLPKKAEKMSKAAILQQTADYLQEMDTRNVNLLKQVSKLRRLLEIKGPKEQTVTAAEVNHVGVQVELLFPNSALSKTGPPKKRQRISRNNSLDDRCNSGESAIAEAESAKCGVAVQTDLFDGSTEIDMLKRRLFELQLALDHERQLSYMREEHYCRKLELSHFGSLGHIPTVSMIDFPVNHHHAAMHNVTKGFAAPGSAMKSAQQSFLPVTGCSLNGDLMCPTPPCATSPQAMVFNSTMPPISSLMPHSQLVAAAAAAERPSTIWVPITETPRAPLPTNVNCDMKAANCPVNKCSTGAQSQQPKQSLNAIIEAIRQLEGEELFVDSDCRRPAKWEQRQSGGSASDSSPFGGQQNGNNISRSVASAEEQQFVQKPMPKIGFENYGTCEPHHREMTTVSS